MIIINECMRIIKREKNPVYEKLTVEKLNKITQKFFEESQRCRPFIIYASPETIAEHNRLMNKSMNDYLERFRERNELR